MAQFYPVLYPQSTSIRAASNNDALNAILHVTTVSLFYYDDAHGKLFPYSILLLLLLCCIVLYVQLSALQLPPYITFYKLSFLLIPVCSSFISM